MTTIKKIAAFFLLVAFLGSVSGCIGAKKCNCPKFSLEAPSIIE